MPREKYHALIDNRIREMKPGSVFVTSDFADMAPTAAINMSLSEAYPNIRISLRKKPEDLLRREEELGSDQFGQRSKSNCCHLQYYWDGEIKRSEPLLLSFPYSHRNAQAHGRKTQGSGTHFQAPVGAVTSLVRNITWYMLCTAPLKGGALFMAGVTNGNLSLVGECYPHRRL